MTGLSYVKFISDSVHGSIGITDVEKEIINSKVFQRLRNIKQLGLVNYVFPGAGYSRLSHSLGVCHVTGKILESILHNHPEYSETTLTNKNIQIYRIAALLHDVGH